MSFRRLTPTLLCSLAVTVLAAGCGLDVKGDPDDGFAGSAGSGAGGSGASGGSGGAAGATASGGVGAGGGGTCKAGLQCVPSAPQGWQYGFLAGSPFSANAPAGEACWDGAPAHRYFYDPVAGTQCAPCACGPLSGGVCTVPLLCSFNTNCSSFQNFTQGNGDCQYEVGGGQLSCMLGGVNLAATGTCQPSGGELVGPDVWKQIADVCTTAPSAACGSSHVCVPHGGGSYEGFVCVYQAGQQSCPAGYDSRTVVYNQDAATDTRACSACKCTPGPASCSGGEYEFYDDGFCLQGSTKVNSTSCKDLTGAINGIAAGMWGYRKSSDPVISGSCAASGGVASGSVSTNPAGALTLCCRSAN